MSFNARGGYNRWCNESPCHNKRRNIMANTIKGSEGSLKVGADDQTEAELAQAEKDLEEENERKR